MPVLSGIPSLSLSDLLAAGFQDPEPTDVLKTKQDELLRILTEPRPTVPIPGPPAETRGQRAAAIAGAIAQAVANYGARSRGFAVPPTVNPAVIELLRRRREREAAAYENANQQAQAAWEGRQRGAEIGLRQADLEARRAEKQAELKAEAQKESAHNALTREMTQLAQDMETKRTQAELMNRKEIAAMQAETKGELQRQRKEDITTQDKKNFALAMDELSAIVHGTGNKDSLAELIKGGKFTPEQAAGLIAAKARRNAILLPPDMASAYAEEVKKLASPVLELFAPQMAPQGPELPPQPSKAKRIFNAIVYGDRNRP